jgi:putative oxidoreductase
MRTRWPYDVIALLARLGVGVVILAHGWQKVQVGVTATGARFQDMGVPAATAAAIYATFAELLGGVALILGFALPVAGILVFLDMAGAFVFVHAGKGVFLVDGGAARNGFELVLVLGVASLLFAAGGGGRLTLDRRLFPPRRERTAAPDPPPAGPRPTGSGSSTGPGEDTRAAEDTAEPARPVTGVVGDTAGDVLVAGRAKRRGGRTTGRDTSPAAHGDPGGEG